MAAWQDPSKPAPAQEQTAPVQDPSFASLPIMGSSMPPMSSYGMPGPTWNKETMDLIVGVCIPPEILLKPEYKDFVIFAAKILQQIQFSNFTRADIRDILIDVRQIFFLSQSDGNEQLFREEQLMLIFKVQAMKARNDSPDGIRERTAWLTSIGRTIFGEDKPKHPEESKGGWNMPFKG
jgi:hypothetical protein